MTITLFIKAFAAALTEPGTNDEKMVLHRSVRAETRLERSIPQLGEAIRWYLLLERVYGRKDRRATAMVMLRLETARAMLPQRARDQVEDLVELLVAENARNSGAARTNDEFIAWANRAYPAHATNFRESA